MSTLTVEDLHFEVRRSVQRRALEITVDRRGELILSAPPDVPEASLLDFVQRKRMWI
jgi:predicted metal-dependent hydrolase